MKLSDFDFDLPEGLIATRPARPRSASKMLVVRPDSLDDAHSIDLSNYLLAGDRLVLNNTKVIPARLSGTRQRAEVQAKIAVTLLDPMQNGQWRALLKPLRKVDCDETIWFSDSFSARLVEKTDGIAILQFNQTADDFDQALRDFGTMPLPPYIASKRPADARDLQDYQTIWARHNGAVAAPTASLHFDAALMDKLVEKGIKITYVTLHVGAGTFLPVKVDDISQHKMHFERGEMTAQAANEINQTRAAGGRIIPVGTTALRLLETASDGAGKAQAWQGGTDIFIAPGYRFKLADALITNFHLPKSTLMMLVSAFMGVERIKDVYAHAIAHNYRFFSYGDASLLLPAVQSRLG